MAVAALGTTLLVLRVAAASRRVLGWILVAAVVAGLLHPVVVRLQGRLRRRGLAVLVVVVATIGSLVAIGYGLVDDLSRETQRLQQVAPERAAELERSERFGDLARDLRVVERTERFVNDIPDRLRGGSTAEALRAAATRGVAFLATSVLTIFFLLHGPDIARAGRDQLPDADKRARLDRFASTVYRRAFGYARAQLAMSVVAGLVAYLLARAAGVPGPVPLALWVGLWDLVPVAGAAIGALPIVALAAVSSGKTGLVLGALFVAFQLVEQQFVQRPVEARTLRLGPFLTLAAGLVGLEVSGIAGALLFVLAAAAMVAAAEELAGP